MSEFHFAYLSLGSNMKPEVNLPKAVQLLSRHGEIQKVSSVWESEPVGTTGANYLNICLLFKSTLLNDELKEKVIHPVEAQLGRKRSDDKFAPRTIDIDIVVFNDEFVNDDNWALAYIIIPLAEILPHHRNSKTEETMAVAATRLRRKVWIEAREGVVIDLR